MDTSLTFPTWANVFTLVGGILIGATPSLVNYWLNSKKVSKELHETQSRTELNLVQIRSTELRDDLATGESVGNMLTTLIQTGETIRDQQQEIFELKGRTLRAEADAQVAQLFVEQLNAAAKLITCEHYPHGVKLSDYAPHQLKKAMQASEEDEDSRPEDYH